MFILHSVCVILMTVSNNFKPLKLIFLIVIITRVNCGRQYKAITIAKQ